MKEPATISNFKFSPLKLFLTLAVLLGGIYFASRSGGNPLEYKNDFNVYFFAAQEVLAGRTPYANSLGEWTPYLYPPLLAELLAPFTLLPLGVVAYLWFLLNAFSLMVALRLSERLIFAERKAASNDLQMDEKARREQATKGRKTELFNFPAKPETLLSVATLVIFLRFVLDNFDYGQVNLLVTALAVAHVYCWAKGRKGLSALVLALAVAIKITPILLLAFHIAKLRLKYSLACLGLTAAIMLISFAPFGSQADKAFKEFYFRTLANGQGFNLAYHGNQSLQGAVERLSGNTEVTNPSSLTVRAIALLLFALAFFAASRRRDELLSSLPFFCLMVILSPLSWKQHFVMLILPTAFLTGRALREPWTGMKKVLLATLACLFALFNLTSPKLIGTAAAEWCDAHSLIFLGAFILYAVVASLTTQFVAR
jgi:hypothetical protein